MRRSGLIVFATLGACLAVRQAGAASAVDYTQRNEPFATGPSVRPEKRQPEANQAVQQKRVAPATLERPEAAIGERRARIDMVETREKMVREKSSQAPEAVEQPKSRFDGQRARMSTAADTTKPPLVARYQESLVAASATNMARFPAVGEATSAKINRFVFRKNGGEAAASPQHAPVTPAAGGGVPVR